MEVIKMLAVVASGASTAVSLAMIPLPMAFALVPTARQFCPTVFAAHIRVFPAEVNAGPSSTLRVAMLEDGY